MLLNQIQFTQYTFTGNISIVYNDNGNLLCSRLAFVNEYYCISSLCGASILLPPNTLYRRGRYLIKKNISFSRLNLKITVWFIQPINATISEDIVQQHQHCILFFKYNRPTCLPTVSWWLYSCTAFTNPILIFPIPLTFLTASMLTPSTVAVWLSASDTLDLDLELILSYPPLAFLNEHMRISWSLWLRL